MLAPGLLLAVWAGAAPAITPDADIARLFGEVERLERSEANDTIDKVREKDRRARALAPDALRWGERAVGPLEQIARDPKRPPKTRLLAAAVMGMTRDPAAFKPLEAIMLDGSYSDDLRSEAALGLGGLAVDNAARRGAFCKALADEDMPRQTLAAALRSAAKLGCDEPSILEKRAKAIGLRPAPRDVQLARHAIEALGRSFPPEAARALWRLFEAYPSGSAERGACLEALLSDPERLTDLGTDYNEPRALRALREESNAPRNAVLAARLAGRLGTPKCADALRRALRNGDPEVIAESADALAALKVVDAAPELRAIVNGAISDPRFAPKPDRPDPAAQAARIQAALNRLER